MYMAPNNWPALHRSQLQQNQTTSCTKVLLAPSRSKSLDFTVRHLGIPSVLEEEDDNFNPMESNVEASPQHMPWAAWVDMKCHE